MCPLILCYDRNKVKPIMLFKKIRQTILFLFVIICVSNIALLLNQYRQIRVDPEPIIKPGYEFADLPALLKNERAIGYFTDLDFSAESLDTKNFLAAQYRLAPVVLEVNNLHHRLILIDASNSLAAFNLMENLPGTPFYLNPYGKLLVQRQ